MTTAEDAPPTDPRRQRRDARVAQILDAAWELARRDGIAAVSLRDLAAAVGLRQPSLYVYFDSKHALYDAMFADGNRTLIERINRLESSMQDEDPRAALTALLAELVRFSAEDPTRHALLFQHSVPGFEPSPASYALAQEFYGLAVERLAAAGVTEQDDIDLFSALVAGLAHQQAANDPGGERWVRLADRTVDMYLADVAGRRSDRTKGARR